MIVDDHESHFFRIVQLRLSCKTERVVLLQYPVVQRVGRLSVIRKSLAMVHKVSFVNEWSYIASTDQ